MGDTSPFGDASPLGGDASLLGDASLFTDASQKDGCDFSFLTPTSQTLQQSFRARPGSAVEAARPIVYSPGVPLVAGSNAGGSTIQIELPASVAVEVTERRQNIQQVRPAGNAPPTNRMVDACDAKLSHVTLPEIPRRSSDAAASPRADDTASQVERYPAQSFKDWVQREDGIEEAQQGRASPKSVARLRLYAAPTPKVARILPGPVSSACDPEPPDHEVQKGAAEPEPRNTEAEKRMKVSKVSVHFRTSQPAALSSRASAARVTPHARRVGRNTLPAGQAQGPLQLRPESETVSDAPVSQRAVFKDDFVPSPAARPHSAEGFKATRPFQKASSERSSGEAKFALLELVGSAAGPSGTPGPDDVDGGNGSPAWELKQPRHVRGERQKAGTVHAGARGCHCKR